MRGYKKSLRLNWLPRRLSRTHFIGDLTRSFIDTVAVTTFEAIKGWVTQEARQINTSSH